MKAHSLCMHSFMNFHENIKKNASCILRNIASMSVIFINDKHNNTTEMLNKKEYVEKIIKKIL